ncbi:MFS transporter [Solicola gregarius]|uniref:MFS transporter n=1 Tax=Solicola gregarius TaxID=2908642 RepID=A0AA46YMF2_9ACTN|nr:MFS transporter [Solicola gregarius]UYM07692.1 MFS transporter [Solicola gregarius]
MSDTESATHTGALEPGALRRVVAVLCVTQITGFGVLYYAFPVLATEIASDTGWSTIAVTAAFSAGQVTSGVVGIVVGRHIDRFGPRAIMTAGSVLAVPAVLVIAWSPTYAAFVIGWIIAGMAMSAVLYPPAFAALTHWGGSRRVQALTALTLVAGLASTVFAPLTAFTTSHLEWRTTYVVLIVGFAAVTIPAHWYGLRRPWRREQTGDTQPRGGRSRIGATVRSPTFIILAVAMSMTAFSVYAVVINLVPLFIEHGYSAGQGAIALGLGGIGQVCGRLGYARFAAVTSYTVRGAIIIGVVAASTGTLAAVSGPLAALVAASVAVGVGRGTYTLVQATAISDRWGTANFGSLNGILTAPMLIASAIAPFAGAALAELTGSQARSFVVLAAVAAVAAGLFLATTPRSPSPEAAAPRADRADPAGPHD